MATRKKVEIRANMGAGMKVECRAGQHVVLIDQPRSDGGTDTGPTPLEYLLCALAGCIASISRIAAHQKKIALRGMEVTVEGDLDVDTLLGKSQQSRAGFPGITVRAKIDADLTDEQKREFLKEVDERCPVSDNLRQVTTITTEVV
ncbi:MAG: OsmC family protein [Lentisphaerae bacterium]|nr:OsmC family protein [Lentisphaerota bacterium]